MNYNDTVNYTIMCLDNYLDGELESLDKKDKIDVLLYMQRTLMDKIQELIEVE